MTAHEIEKELRTEYWLNHGCGELALQCAEGEQWCNSCFLDFKRAPLEVLRDCAHYARVLKTVVRKMDWS